MSFFDNIKNCIYQDGAPELAGFRAVMFGFSSAYFENVKGILSFTKNEIVLGLKKGKIKLSGEELFVKKYCAGDVVICGQISKIEKF